MVRLRCQLDGGCMAMRLALCLWTGLGLVSASLCGSSSCPMRPRESGRNGVDPHADAANSASDVSSFKRKTVTDKQHNGTGQLAADFGGDQDTRWASNSDSQQSQSHVDSIPAATLSEPSSISSSDSNSSSTSSIKTSDGTDATSAIPISPSTNDDSPATSGSGPPSSSSSISIPSPSTSNTTLSSSATLPNIDLGSTSNDATSNPTNSTLPPTRASTQSPESSGSSSRTKAIVAGTTVPVGIIALGLVALIILRKRRQRSRMLQARAMFTDKHDEIDESAMSATERSVRAVLAVEPIPTDGRSARASDDSHASRSTAHLQSEQARAETRQASNQITSLVKARDPASSKPTRAKSKRKPVPALLDPLDQPIPSTTIVERYNKPTTQ